MAGDGRLGVNKLKHEVPMTHFFVSYADEDKDWAEWIAWQLEEAGHKTTLQAWDFKPGMDFVSAMRHAANEADRTIAVVSPDYLRSNFGAAEWQDAFAQDPNGERGLLIPVRVRDYEAPPFLRNIIRISLVGLDENAARDKLLTGLDLSRAKPTTQPRYPGSTSVAEDAPHFPGSHEDQSASPRGAVASTPTAAISPAGAAEILERYRWGLPDKELGTGWTAEVWVGLVTVPVDFGVQFLDDLTPGDTNFQGRVRGLALTPPGDVLSAHRGTQLRETMDGLLIEQRFDRYSKIAAQLRVETNDVIAQGVSIEADPAHTMAGTHIISEDAVRDQLTRSIAFAKAAYAQLDKPVGAVYVAASLFNTESRYFGQLPKYELTSMTIADHRLPDPLGVPFQDPLIIERIDSVDAVHVADVLVKHIIRAFRVAGYYYSA
jgi:hypothetical protein